jgi:hypothetical protein
MTDVLTVDDYIGSLDEHLQEPARKLRDILDTELTAADSLMWEGRPTWVIGKVPVAAFQSGNSCVILLLFRGDEITDSTGTLTVHDDGRSTLRIERNEDIDEDLFMGWLRQVQDVEG